MPLTAHRRHVVSSVLHVFPALLLYQHLLCPNILILIVRGIVQARISTPRQTQPTSSIRIFALAITSLNVCAILFHALDLMDDGDGVGRGLVLDFVGIKTPATAFQIFTLDILILLIQIITIYISFLSDYRVKVTSFARRPAVHHELGEVGGEDEKDDTEGPMVIEWLDPLLPKGADDAKGWFFVGLGSRERYRGDDGNGKGKGKSRGPPGGRTRRYERMYRMEEGRGGGTGVGGGGEDGEVVDLTSPVIGRSINLPRGTSYGEDQDEDEYQDRSRGSDRYYGAGQDRHSDFDTDSETLLPNNGWDPTPHPRSRILQPPPPPLIFTLTLHSLFKHIYSLPSPEPERRMFSGGTPSGTPVRGSSSGGLGSSSTRGGDARSGATGMTGSTAASEGRSRTSEALRSATTSASEERPFLGVNSDGTIDSFEEVDNRDQQEMDWTPEPLVDPVGVDSEEEDEPEVRMPGAFAASRRTRSQGEVESTGV